MPTSSQTTVASSGDGRPPPASLDRRLCDAALDAYWQLSPEYWRGNIPFLGGEIIFSNSELARGYLAAATHAARANHDPVGAIRLLDVSIRLDYIDLLNEGDNLIQRIEAYASLGSDEPRRSILLYNLGVTFSRLKLWAEAGSAYRAAAELDPLFAWHLNNFAWMAATATDPLAHAGDLAVALAERACVVSGWGCWSFLGTLAAALARAGDFRRAVAWQQIAVHLAPGSEREELSARLHEFEARRAFVDQDPNPVGGESISDEELAKLDVQELLREARALIGTPPESVH